MNEPISIFNYTGETRPPKKGEWYKTLDGQFCEAFRDFPPDADRPIFTRTEIQVPEGATDFGHNFKVGDFWGLKWNPIPLPQPKPKKKYRWRCTLSGITMTTEPITDEDARRLAGCWERSEEAQGD